MKRQAKQGVPEPIVPPKKVACIDFGNHLIRTSLTSQQFRTGMISIPGEEAKAGNSQPGRRRLAPIKQTQDLGFICANQAALADKAAERPIPPPPPPPPVLQPAGDDTALESIVWYQGKKAWMAQFEVDVVSC